ncbi:MAG: hypothetical protein KDK34_08030, partial [Leptospiraceae bacterium]|nr:hypothetical protein [Leptospiraceae bacterium]
VDENSVVRALEDCMHNRKGPCKAVTRLADFSAIKEHLQKGDQVICLGAGDISAHLHDYVRENGRLFETSMPME